MSKPKSRVDDPRVKVNTWNGKHYHTLNGRRLHRIKWEEKFGPIAPELLLVCKTDDTMNLDLNNWELLTQTENIKRMRERVRNLDKPVKVCCSKCGEQFETTDKTRRLCDYCSTNVKARRTYTTICSECGVSFTTTESRKVTCSDECSRLRKNKQFRSYYKQNPERYKSASKRQTYAKRKTSSGDKRGVENVPVEKMFELNRNAPKHDREIIQRKGIKSPDVSKMEYKVYDPKLRKTTYFRSKERYEEFLQQQDQNQAS